MINIGVSIEEIDKGEEGLIHEAPIDESGLNHSLCLKMNVSH